MRLLGRGHSGGLLAALRLERRRNERSPVYLHKGDGLRLSRVPLLRHYYLPRASNSGVLYPHLSGDRKAG